MLDQTSQKNERKKKQTLEDVFVKRCTDHSVHEGKTKINDFKIDTKLGKQNFYSSYIKRK